ncbi:MAG: 30S ribosomal protein S6e [Euryarchaeota archaeon]|nr:30S ribosomal protein S6e [Euryarchaeota archaeon]
MQKIIISESAKSFHLDLDEEKARAVVGLELGNVLDGTKIGLPGYKLQITGGSDKDGFPMRPDVRGRVRPRILMSKGPGYRPLEAGVKRRKRVRGNVITTEIVQINTKVVEKGAQGLEELLVKAEGEKKPEKKGKAKQKAKK